MNKLEATLGVGLAAVAVLIALICIVVIGVFAFPASGFNTIKNVIYTIATSVIFSGLSGASVIEYLKLQTGLKQTPTPHSKNEHYLRHYRREEPELTDIEHDAAPAPTSTSKTVVKHPYVTIHGKEPTESISFFHTRKFIAIAAILGAVMVLLFFLLVG